MSLEELVFEMMISNDKEEGRIKDSDYVSDLYDKYDIIVYDLFGNLDNLLCSDSIIMRSNTNLDLYKTFYVLEKLCEVSFRDDLYPLVDYSATQGVAGRLETRLFTWDKSNLPDKETVDSETNIEYMVTEILQTAIDNDYKISMILVTTVEVGDQYGILLAYKSS